MRLRNLLILGATIVLLLSSGHCEAKTIEILYVNANVGTAAGGHVGIRLGEDVFHYQFFPDERFLLVREPWSHFRLIYNRLRNRSILSLTCSVTDVGFAKIKATLIRTLAFQRDDFQRYRLLLRRLKQLDSLQSGQVQIEVAGLGLFSGKGAGSVCGRRIREAVENRLGRGFLEQEQARVSRKIETLSETIGAQTLPVADLLERLDLLDSLVRKRSALRVLHEAAPLEKEALMTSAKRLTNNQIAVLSWLLKKQTDTFIDLLRAERDEKGEALILQLARCLAIDLSIENKSLITLDPYANDAAIKQIDATDSDLRIYLEGVAGFLEEETNELLLLLGQVEPGTEILVYSLLEKSNGKLNEVEASLATAGKRPIRLATESMVPSRSATVLLDLPYRKPEQLGKARSLLQKKLDRLMAQVKIKYSYQLLERNCVTELLFVINESFKSPQEAEKLLGGWIDPRRDHVIVPYDFFRRVKSTYRVEAFRHYRSRRLAALANMEKEKNGLALWLREGNTLSSTLYKRRPQDSSFLFFTDDHVLMRPALGLLNLGWGAVHGIGGVFILPFDRGQSLWQGLRGMFYSLPELTFCNIRKGSYEYDNLSERKNDL